MTDWHSELTLQQNAASFAKLIHALLGIIAWEWVITLNFEISLFLGKRKFRWPMIFYFWGRYAMLGGVIGICVLLDSPTPVNCQVGYLIAAILGNTALSVSSLNLSLRTMVIWNQDRRIVIPLVLMSLAHFGIVLRSVVNAKAVWVDGSGCVTSEVNSHIYVIMFSYTMAFDFIVLLLTGFKMWDINRKAEGVRQQSNGLIQFLFRDGLLYFIVAFVVNLIAVVFSVLHLNPIMAIIADTPAAVMATIVSGRVVRRLSSCPEKSRETSDNLRARSSIGFHTSSSGNRTKTGEVHVEMSTFEAAQGDINRDTKSIGPSASTADLDLEDQRIDSKHTL